VNLQQTVTLARRLASLGDQAPEVIIQRAIDESLEREPLDPDTEQTAKESLQNHLLGFGAIQRLMDDSTIEEIWINSPDEVFVARSGISESLSIAIQPDELRVIIERMLRTSGRRLDRSSPFVDASLPDGSRLHAAIPEITRKYWSVNIRKFPKQIIRLKDLVNSGTIGESTYSYFLKALAAKKNFLVSGATQAGKTTVLCALLNESPEQQRIVSVEETFEIRVARSDWVGLQTRQANLEGVGEITLRRLVKESLRMRPDRLVVGEVREAEALDLLIALNSGLPGACTIHANSAREAISKLCTLPLLAGQNISDEFVRPTVGNCIDVVVHCTLNANGTRSISEVLEVSWNTDTKEIEFHEVADALA
jgi:pilus assembly protein CpaF